MNQSDPSVRSHEVVIVGGGAGGLSVAAMLKRHKPELSIAVIEPSAHHYYQPAWTLVGGGAYDIEKTRRPEGDLIPKGVEWIQARAAAFEPDAQRVVLEDGRRVEYRYLVMAAGLQINWSQIEGLEETLGKNGVTSNYRYDLAPYTWECVKAFQGGRALFTQPGMPIKCAGAPQKILYLANDHWKRRGIQAQSEFLLPGGAMFGVPFYSKALDQVMAHYGAKPKFGHLLVAVDGAKKEAVFEVTEGETKRRVTESFDFLHVTPPQGPPDFIRHSPLAAESGWVEVDKSSLRHLRYGNVFGLGDCTTTPNSKTAAAVRAQIPVLVENLLAVIAGKEPVAAYDGYASCPLTTSRGKVMLAEFAYGGVVTPSFPLDPRKPRRSYWLLKREFLPSLYWDKMLRGNMGPDWHAARQYPDPVPALTP